MAELNASTPVSEFLKQSSTAGMRGAMGAGDMLAANNLGDVADPEAARSNLGVTDLVSASHATLDHTLRASADGGSFDGPTEPVAREVARLMALGLYEEASLILVPAAEKSGKLYSVKGPDLTFTRASDGTIFDRNGQLGTRATDIPRIDGQGDGVLLEEQRTNLLLNSDTLSTQAVTVTAVAHTLSFTGTGTVTLTGASTAGPLVGTGAGDRVSLTFTPTAGSLTITVSGSVTLAQLEAGSTATSYIPTAGASVTRAADNLSLSGSAFAQIWNPTEGTLLLDGVILAKDSFAVTGPTVNYRFLYENASLIKVYDGATGSTLGSYSVGDRFRAAVTFSAAELGGSLNGGAAQISSAAGAILGATELRLRFTGSLQVNSLNYTPRRLSNSELQALSAL